MTLVEKVEDGKGRMGGGGEGVGAGVGMGGVVGLIPSSLAVLDDLPLASFGGAVRNHFEGFRMVYLYYISCLRYTILAGNPRFVLLLLSRLCLWPSYFSFAFEVVCLAFTILLLLSSQLYL